MPLDWFNTREATQVGATLADYFLPEGGVSATGGRKTEPPKNGHADLQKFLQRVAREATPLKLNLIKRAKLLNTFKWRLLEHGLDRKFADELTELVLLQLSGRSLGLPVPAGSFGSRSVDRITSRRVPALLAESDARFGKREYTEAAERLREVLAVEPRHAVAHAKLGAVLSHMGRYREAEQEFRRAIELKPTCADAHFNLGNLLRWKGDFAASESALRHAAKRNPRNSDALVSLAYTLVGLGRPSDARNCLEKALRLNSRDATALSGLGWLQSLEGRFEEAERLLQSALERDPRCSQACALLAELRRMTTADKSWLDSAERILAAGLSPIEEAKLRFAMGKYFDDLGAYSRAFEQYKRGNELYKLLAAPYDRHARSSFVDDMIRLYTRRNLTQALDGASESARPVFVVGMMRSGTTLVEQIIASHPDAIGAGELDFWNAMLHKQKQSLQQKLPDGASAKKLADSYVKELARRSPGALRVVDKSTFNSDCIGLIHCVFPQARFIYLRRDPLDTCLSCYFHDFANLAGFTLDLSDLAHYYREHHRLMAHWRSALPEGTLLEVPYAELVADQENWSRRIIEFIGLAWDPRCIEFHNTERPILTASSWQVRQRMYSSSIGRWRNYQKFIGPLLKLRDLEP